MAVQLTSAAPNLPNPPAQYDQAQSQQFNNALRLYFQQLDSLNQTETQTLGNHTVMLWLGGL